MSSKKWYVIQTYSGYEKKVRETIYQRVKDHNMEGLVGEILIPTESVTEVKSDGKQRVRQRSSYPGYVFVQMDFNEELWHVVKNTPKVTGIVGNQKPREMRESEVNAVRRVMEEGVVRPKPKVNFAVGDEIKVTDGAFANFSGNVEEVNLEKQRLKVKVSIFGRATPIELEFSQVAKIDKRA
jgi:transcriptional antiterminator NusG